MTLICLDKKDDDGYHHFHDSRYPHSDWMGNQFSAIRCTGRNESECALAIVAGEISRMLEFEFQKLGGNPNNIIARHRKENPQDWKE